jgi:hypothetical protein
MTLIDTTPKKLSSCNGSSTAFSWPITNWVQDSDHLKVYLINTSVTPYTKTLLTEGALQDYQISGVDVPNGIVGTGITTTLAYSSSYKILQYRDVPLEQERDYEAGGSFPLEDHELGLDLIFMILQELQEQLDRSVKMPLQSASSPPIMGEPSASTAVVWSSDALTLEAGPSVSSISTAATNATAAAASATAAAASAVSAAASAAIASASARTVTGSKSSPVAIVAGTGVAPGAYRRELIYVQGSGGAVDISVNPQISAGIYDGQELELCGCSDTNTLLLEDGTGLKLNGSCTLGLNWKISLAWDQTNWVEVSRSEKF